MIELTPVQTKVARDVLAWLENEPSTGDIENYVSLVQKKDPEALLGVFVLAPEQLSKLKRDFFKAKGAENFVKELSEFDQLLYIMAFTKYSPSSVIDKMLKKHQVAIPALSTEVTDWAKDYMSIWEGVLLMQAHQDMDRRLQYVRSFQRVPASNDQLRGIMEGSSKSLEMLKKRYLRDLQPSTEDLAEERTALALVPFFPPEFIENELRAADDPGKKRLFEDMLFVSSLLISLEGQPTESIEVTLQELVKGEKERTLLAAMESLRKNSYPEINSNDKYFDLFDQAFTLENIEKKQVASTIKAGSAAFTDTTQFTAALYAYIRNNPLIDELIAPYDIDFILSEISLLLTDSEIPVLLKSLEIGIETSERRLFFLPLMSEFFALTHMYKEN